MQRSCLCLTTGMRAFALKRHSPSVSAALKSNIWDPKPSLLGFTGEPLMTSVCDYWKHVSEQLKVQNKATPGTGHHVSRLFPCSPGPGGPQPKLASFCMAVA